MGWDSDNPTATWGGLIGFMIVFEGVEKAFNENEHLANGLNIKNSEVVHEGVKEALSA